MTVTLFDTTTMTVQVGFSTSAGAGTVPLGSTLASIVWTDVTEYVQEVSTNRGRSTELDTFTTGSATVVFKNDDRRFDPEHDSGPYFGSLTPNRPLRILASYAGGATTPLFFGWVDGWPQTYLMQFASTVTVTASDAFKVLNLLKLEALESWWLKNLGTTRWFRLDDADGSSKAFSYPEGSLSGTWSNSSGVTTSTSTAGLLVNDSNTAAAFDGTKHLGFYIGGLTEFNVSGSQISGSFSCWLSSSETADQRYGIAEFGPETASSTLIMSVSGGVGRLLHYYSDQSFSATTLDTYSNIINDGKPHHILFVRNPSLTPVSLIYIDGVVADLSSSVASNKLHSEFLEEMLGYGRRLKTNNPRRFIGTIDEVTTYNGVFNSTEVQDTYNVGIGTYGAGDVPGNRIPTILGLAEWMSDGQDINLGAANLSGINIEGKTVLSAIQEVETAEQGRLFINAAGQVRFLGRQLTSTAQNVSQRTYGDAGDELPYTSFESSYNDQNIFNRVSVTQNNGPTYTVDDAASQSQYFVKSNELSNVAVDTVDQVVAIGDARLFTYKQPAFRVDAITVNPRSSPAALFNAVIGDEIGTRVTVKRRPQGVGSVISQELIIEGVGHTITADSWSTSYRLSPAPYVMFQLDNASFGVVGSNRLGF